MFSGRTGAAVTAQVLLLAFLLACQHVHSESNLIHGRHPPRAFHLAGSPCLDVFFPSTIGNRRSISTQGVSALRACAKDSSSQRVLPAIIVTKAEMLSPGEKSFLDFSDKSAKKALKRARKGGDQRKDGKAGKLAMVCLDETAIAERRMELDSLGCEVDIIAREKTSTQSIAGDSSLSFKVEVEAVQKVAVSPKPVQLEPFVMASISAVGP